MINSVIGTIADGENIIVNGSGFGTHILDIEWLGGPTGNIEQGLDGGNFSKTKWSSDNDSEGFYSPRYSTAKAHSNSKSIVSQYPQESQFGSGYTYDHGVEFGIIYATWWVCFDHVDSAGQWKLWRLSPSDTYDNVDGSLYQNIWYYSDGSIEQAMIMLFCDASEYDQCYPGGDGSHRWIDHTVPVDTWVRMELYAKESSAPGVRDGIFSLDMHKQTETSVSVANWDSTIITRATGVIDRWKFMVFQNYWGNIVGGPGTNEKFYIDDIYIQVGSKARVEIGDNSDWSLCTHREIQIPTVWADGSITATVNQGSFLSGSTAYLFVVDAAGNAGDGYQIVFGGGGGGGGTTSSPSKLPVSLAEAKAHLRINKTFTDDDSYVTSLINVAAAYAESFCNRRLITQTREKVFEAWSDVELNFLPGGQLQEVVQITWLDEDKISTPLSVDSYIVAGVATDEGRIEFVNNVSLPTNLYQVAPIRVDFIAGYYQGEVWTAKTSQLVNNSIIANYGLIAKCIIEGTTGENSPVWPVSVGGICTDGTVTWEIIGWAVPDMIKQAILLLIAAYYENREPVSDLTKNTVDTLLLPCRIWGSTV